MSNHGKTSVSGILRQQIHCLTSGKIRKCLSSLARKYLGLNFDPNYGLDDYVILAKKSGDRHQILHLSSNDRGL